MAAPTLTARVEPVGIKLDDGYRTTFAFSQDPDISLWEKEVGLPGIDGGEAIDNTTMHNDVYRTASSRALKTLTPFTIKAAYDPAVYTQLVNIINVEGSITEHLPDGSTLTYYAFAQKAEFDPLVEGNLPMVNVTIVPTNKDPQTGAEEGPVLVSVSGT